MLLCICQPAGKGECLEDGVDTAGEGYHPLVGTGVGARYTSTSLQMLSIPNEISQLCPSGMKGLFFVNLDDPASHLLSQLL